LGITSPHAQVQCNHGQLLRKLIALLRERGVYVSEVDHT